MWTSCLFRIYNSLYHLLFKGLVDLKKEIGKLEKKEEGLNNQLEKLLNSIKIDDYKTKVPCFNLSKYILF